MKVRDNTWKRCISNIKKNVRNPFTGQKGNPYMSFDEDSAVIHRMATLGICVLDPTRTMSIIPAILQG
jgi:hypothetical protein|nr:MAG TPA: major capsid protein [Crassvirales sp.]